MSALRLTQRGRHVLGLGVVLAVLVLAYLVGGLAEGVLASVLVR